MPPWCGNLIKLMVFPLLENEFESQKIDSTDFLYSCSLKTPHTQRETIWPPNHYPPWKQERENYEKSSFAQYVLS